MPPYDLAARLLIAWERRDEVALSSVLHRDVVLIVDSGDETGGELCGRVRVVRALSAQLARYADVSLQPVHVSGRSGIALRRDGGEVVGVLSLDGAESIGALWLSTAPAKLAHWNRRRPDIC